MNKKGAEMTVGTLVVIVLAIIVLVVVALGFGTGWTNLWSKITGYFSPVNVDSIKQACVYACSTQAQYDYCNTIRTVNYLDANKAKQKVEGTCNQLRNNQDKDGKAIINLGFESCSEIPSCPAAT